MYISDYNNKVEVVLEVEVSSLDLFLTYPCIYQRYFGLVLFLIITSSLIKPRSVDNYIQTCPNKENHFEVSVPFVI